MADDEKYYPHPASYYALYDMIDKNNPLAYFDSLTGGNQVVSMVTYNVIDGKGNVTTKVMPGQTTFEPVTLLRAVDIFSKEVKDRFYESVAGKLKTLRNNYSVCMFDGNGDPVVWWHLFNAVPTSITGFSFNSKTAEYYTDFEITLQAESIFMQFEPISDDPMP